MGKTKRVVEVAYLDRAQIDALKALSARTRIPRAVLMREAVDMLLNKYPVGISATDEWKVGVAESTKLEAFGSNRERPVSHKAERERTESPGLWDRDPSKPVRRVHEADRVKDLKTHVVTDARTSATLLRKVEKLSAATGRGSAKPMKTK